jgi:hypothetical protein
MATQIRKLDETHFLNVDLDIYSNSDLQPLVDAFGKKVSVLHCGRIHRTYKAVLEVTKYTTNPDATIRALCDLIAALPAPAKRLWKEAKSRDFSIGIQAGEQPNSTDFALSADTVMQAAKVGARILITVYGAAMLKSGREPG